MQSLTDRSSCRADEDTNSELSDDTTTTDPIQRFDFGSIATRKLRIVHGSDSSNGGTLSYRVGDTPGSGSWVDIYVGTGTVTKTSLIVSPTSFRYVDIRLQRFNTGLKTVQIYEVSDDRQKFATITFDMEIEDTLRNTWIPIPDMPSIPTIDTEGGNQQIVNEINIILPHKNTGLLRIVQTLTGRANYSCALVKVNPCKA